jgi:hypothetical protein
MNKLHLFICIIILIGVATYWYKEHFSGFETTFFTFDAVQRLAKDNSKRYNSICTIKTTENKDFQFAYPVMRGSIPLWYKTNDPNACSFELSGDDLAGDPLMCSKNNSYLYDEALVENVALDDADMVSKRCEVRFKPNLSESALSTYLQRQKSFIEAKKLTKTPYCANEDQQSSLTSDLNPTWEYQSSKGRWTQLRAGTNFEYGTINLFSNTQKSFTFWINIQNVNNNWRNIFHITASGNCCSPGERAPGVWIWPGSTRFLVVHDTSYTANDWYGIDGADQNQNTFVALVWNENKFSVYINDDLIGEYTLRGTLTEPQTTSKFYIADPWYPCDGFMIKNFHAWDRALTKGEVAEIKNLSTTDPSYSYAPSMKRWIRLTKGENIPYKKLAITSTKVKSFTFYLWIQRTHNTWRNVFHITNNNRDCCNPGDRVPGMWVWPDSTRLHIAHDTSANNNETFNQDGIEVKKPAFVALVWNLGILNVYIDGILKGSYEYKGDLIDVAPDAKVYLSDVWYENVGLFVRKFESWNRALTADDVKALKK